MAHHLTQVALAAGAFYAAAAAFLALALADAGNAPARDPE